MDFMCTIHFRYCTSRMGLQPFLAYMAKICGMPMEMVVRRPIYNIGGWLRDGFRVLCWLSVRWFPGGELYFRWLTSRGDFTWPLIICNWCKRGREKNHHHLVVTTVVIKYKGGYCWQFGVGIDVNLVDLLWRIVLDPYNTSVFSRCY